MAKIVFLRDSLTEGSTGISYLEILQSFMPEHELVNLGKSGDTVPSLLRRIRAGRSIPPCDMAFLWAGVNDVLIKTFWAYPPLELLRGTSRPHHRSRSLPEIMRALFADDGTKGSKTDRRDPGFQFTLDRVHLNRAGAAVVAQTFRETVLKTLSKGN